MLEFNLSPLEGPNSTLPFMLTAYCKGYYHYLDIFDKVSPSISLSDTVVGFLRERGTKDEGDETKPTGTRVDE